MGRRLMDDIKATQRRAGRGERQQRAEAALQKLIPLACLLLTPVVYFVMLFIFPPLAFWVGLFFLVSALVSFCGSK
jgi:hypothetical protein